MLSFLLRLVRTAGTCSPPFSDWFGLQEHALFPSPIGSDYKSGESQGRRASVKMGCKSQERCKGARLAGGLAVAVLVAFH
eukprot:5617794-Pyramimonas_sp.AAC.1